MKLRNSVFAAARFPVAPPAVAAVDLASQQRSVPAPPPGRSTQITSHPRPIRQREPHMNESPETATCHITNHTPQHELPETTHHGITTNNAQQRPQHEPPGTDSKEPETTNNQITASTQREKGNRALPTRSSYLLDLQLPNQLQLQVLNA
jgi:hypothetical protein